MRSLLRRLIDHRDERLARELRQALGASGLIASWHRVDPSDRESPGGPWLARVSCREWPSTIEDTGRSRRKAVLRAAAALAKLSARH